MEIADADKRAEWAYRTCGEIWTIQGRVKSHPFSHAIFDFCLQPMFAVREGCFKHEVELHLERTGERFPQGISAIVSHVNRGMGKLRAKWRTKLEIAARDNAYRQQRILSEGMSRDCTMTAPVSAEPVTDLSRLSETFDSAAMPSPKRELLPLKQVAATALSFTWRELENRFKEIQAKSTLRQRVSAEFTRTEWGSGSIAEEWGIRGNSICRTEFERLASIAARKLGYAGSEDEINHWLDHVREWMERTGLNKDKDVAWCPTGNGSSNGKAYKTVHLTTHRIAEISAMFCVELMARGFTESAVALTLEHSQAERQTSTARIKLKTSKTKVQLYKTGVIFGAIQLGLKGRKYCAALDDRKVPLPEQWKEEGSPDIYVKAYVKPRWRKRIQDEKSRYREQYDMTSTQDREAIIQNEASTRSTRH